MNSLWLWIGLALTLLVTVLSFGSLTFSLPDPPAAAGTSLSRDVGMALQGLGVSTPSLTGVMTDALHTLKEGVIR